MEPVDFSVLAAFKELMGDEGDQEVRDLVALYLEDGPVQLDTMASSLAASDGATLKRAAHSFKSSCANIGAMELQAVCLQLEQEAGSGEPGSACHRLVTQIKTDFAGVKMALETYLSN